MTEERLHPIADKAPLDNLKNILSQADHVALSENPPGQQRTETSKREPVNQPFANTAFLDLNPVEKLDELIKAHRANKTQFSK